jgi:hypothetical protein
MIIQKKLKLSFSYELFLFFVNVLIIRRVVYRFNLNFIKNKVIFSKLILLLGHHFN